MQTPTGIFYSEDHEWVKVEGNVAFIGISDFAQDALGDIVFVEAPEVEAELQAGDVFGSIESIKAVSDTICPVSGKVIAVNEDLDGEPERLNTAPYENWIMQVEMSDPSQVEGLMDAAAYATYCETCEH